MTQQYATQPRAGRTTRPCYLLHVFSSFERGGVAIRMSNIINLIGQAYRHMIVSMDGCYDCKSRLEPEIQVEFADIPVSSHNLLSTIRRLRTTLREVGPDLLLTYNWGSIEWALANSLFPICPHIHFESGFGTEEADGQIKRRAILRRIALRGTSQIVVPSQTLVQIATRIWTLDPQRVLYVPNGVDVAKFSRAPEPGTIPGFDKLPSELIVGTVAPLRAEKNLAHLLRAFAGVSGNFDTRLLIVGDGSQRASLEGLARALKIEQRVVFAGHVEAVEKVLGWFDVFAMSSDTEQMPNSLLQAMAAGLPVAATDVGDVKHILAPDNAPFVVPKDDGRGLSDALNQLLADRETRLDLGHRNQNHVRAHYSQERMTLAYQDLFESACAGRASGRRHPASEASSGRLDAQPIE